METLRLGSEGSEVKKLQRALIDAKFSPGVVDGQFGPGTESAVVGFQKSQCLLADGIVGSRTAKALGLMDETDTRDAPAESVIENVTVSLVSQLFPFTPLDNIKENLPHILKGLEKQGLTEKPMVLMALATIRAETEGFEPISEYRSRYNTSPGGKHYDLYDFRTDIGNNALGDGAKYKGRGFIQLTGKSNYETYGPKIGVDNLADEPELANSPEHAANVLAVFLKDKERQIKEAILDGNLRLARKLVNGGSHGLNQFTETYQRGEELLA